VSPTPLPDEFKNPVVFTPVSVEAAVAPEPKPRSRAWLGLLWCEWFAHSRLLLFVFAAWLAAVWTLPPFAYPDWILLLGIVYAVLAGPAYGGGDVVEGCEEFSFALPPTRSERYLARLVVGAGALLILTGMNLIVLGLDVSQALARLYLDTGLAKPKQITNPGLLYGLVLAFPFAVFSGAFACAAITRSRALVLTSWFWGGLGALVLLLAGMRYEELMWTRFNGLFACPVLVVGGLVVLWIGHRFYCRKEVGPDARPLALPARWWLWALGFLLGVALALALLSSVLRSLPRLLGP